MIFDIAVPTPMMQESQHCRGVARKALRLRRTDDLGSIRKDKRMVARSIFSFLRTGALGVGRDRYTPAARSVFAPRRHRTIFISDVHLGTRGCKAELLADFLATNDCETLYLVGDIVDGWQLKRRWYWTTAQTTVVHEILRKADAGTRVIYIPGNHDEFLRRYCGRTIAGVEIVAEAIHETADGKRLLVMHGDAFDSIIDYAKWLAQIGDRAYTVALAMNDRLHALRARLGRPYWSLSAYLKRKVKNAVEYVSRFEEVVARAALPHGVDGVLCGHIHHAEMRRIGPILYVNDGDWVESCTAVVEDARGHLEILRWARSDIASDTAPADAGAEGEAALIPA